MGLIEVLVAYAFVLGPSLIIDGAFLAVLWNYLQRRRRHENSSLGEKLLLVFLGLGVRVGVGYLFVIGLFPS